MSLGLIGILLALAIPVPCTEELIEDDVVYEAAPSKPAARTAPRKSPAPRPHPQPVVTPPARWILTLDPSPARRSGIDWIPRLFSRPPPL